MSIATAIDVIDLDAYAEGGPPHELWTALRRESPVHWCEHPDMEPFWAITRHADICAISRQPDKFLSAPGITLRQTVENIQEGEGLGAMRVVIMMDPPEHRAVRKVASPWFTPRALKRIDAAVDASARQLVDELAAQSASGEGVADLANEIAVRHPLRILSTALGLRRDQEEKVLELSNRLFAADDDELGGGNTPEEFQRLGMEFLQLFLPIIEERRKNPTDDLASVLANGLVNGEAMGPMETLGYYLIVFNAGHDTTKNALAGGIRALVEHPEQFARLQADPDGATPLAVEEILRWSSSVNYMKRTAAIDTEVNGQKIRAGESLVMFYGSANRDEDVFQNPFDFDITRDPNRHVAFGYGEHFCMGAHFARRSMRAIVLELARRVQHWELAGDPDWIRSNFVVGLKHLPVQYHIRG